MLLKDLICCFALVILITISVTAFTQPVKFVTPLIEPWGYIDGEGKARGLLINFFNALQTKTEHEATNEFQPYPRALHSLK